MRILAIDTATEACSVALWNDGTVNAHFELCPREHTQRILPMVQDILTTSGTSLTDINALAYGRGPGSFTGLRIGFAVSNTLAASLNIPNTKSDGEDWAIKGIEKLGSLGSPQILLPDYGGEANITTPRK